MRTITYSTTAGLASFHSIQNINIVNKDLLTLIAYTNMNYYK